MGEGGPGGASLGGIRRGRIVYLDGRVVLLKLRRKRIGDIT